MLPRMHSSWLDDDARFLGRGCPLPLDRPFDVAMADSLGVGRRQLARMTVAGHLRPLVRGVYAAAQLPDTMTSRTAALALVVSEDAVVCSRTAAWLHGVPILPRSARMEPPPVQCVHVTDTRVRRPGVDGRRRQLLPHDVVEVGGIRVTTPLRTALDLGRLLWRYDALAALDGFLRHGVDHHRLIEEMPRFRGYRGVIQLRALAPLADPRAESPGESALRLNWIESGLPSPELQWWVEDDLGHPIYRLDLADPECRYCAEYDGEDFHTNDADRAHDDGRRDWLRDRGWTIDVFTKKEIYGRQPDPLPILVGGHAEARRTHQLWTP
jgi:hypothetical protein